MNSVLLEGADESRVDQRNAETAQTRHQEAPWLPPREERRRGVGSRSPPWIFAGFLSVTSHVMNSVLQTFATSRSSTRCRCDTGQAWGGEGALGQADPAGLGTH